MGGVNKPLLEVGGMSLLNAAIAAAHDAGCDPIVAVGDAAAGADARTEVTWVREDPPFGGPAAAILAALPRVAASRVLVLACDLPEVRAAVRLLLAIPFDGDGACLVDEAGRRQWLAGIYRTDALRTAGAALPQAGQGASVRMLLGGLSVTAVAASDELAADIDTWDDLNQARRRNP